MLSVNENRIWKKKIFSYKNLLYLIKIIQPFVNKASNKCCKIKSNLYLIHSHKRDQELNGVIERSENKFITQFLLSENEVKPGVPIETLALQA